MNELIVVAAHGPDHIAECVASLPDVPRLVVDTGSRAVPNADVMIDGGYPQAAYLWAYEQYAAFDRFLFIQDSMVCTDPDPLHWFRQQLPKGGVVAWQRFPMQWDTQEQVDWVQAQYPGVNPSHGIFGPVFYCDRSVLDLVVAKRLVPARATVRWQAQATERAWAYAFAAAGIPVAGPEWQPHDLVAGTPVGPFRKTFASRP